LGNHDAFLCESALVHEYTTEPLIVEAVDWCRNQLAQDDIAFLRTFQPRLEIALDDSCALLLFHGSPRSHSEDLLAATPPLDVDRLLAGFTATVLAGGHTHIQMLRQHRGMLLVNPGSVGMPFKEYVAGRAPTILAHAEYAVVEARDGVVMVSLHRVPLKRELLREAAALSGDHPLRGVLLQHYA
jgi:predicted phosphodiesterase